MIKIENVQVVGWEHAIRGMRNPKNSWGRSDSDYRRILCDRCDNCLSYQLEQWEDCDNCEVDIGCKAHDGFMIGPNDHKLMMSLAYGGPVHAKYRRMIVVYLDITAPLYWWKEYDTYKVGSVANSCSTMHKIAEKEFTLEDFSYEHLNDDWAPCGVNGGDHFYPLSALDVLKITIDALNYWRRRYLATKNKDDWWQMIQLLPSSYNQKRTVMLNYEVLHNIYISRKAHKLDEWRDFCKWIESLPYPELITGNEL